MPRLSLPVTAIGVLLASLVASPGADALGTTAAGLELFAPGPSAYSLGDVDSLFAAGPSSQTGSSRAEPAEDFPCPVPLLERPLPGTPAFSLSISAQWPRDGELRVGVEPPVRQGLRNENAPYGKKFLRGTIIITGAELVSLGILLAMPRSTTQWSEHPLEQAAANLKRAWTSPPVWDGDIPFHNYIGHPYAGAFYYNMVRSQAATPTQSFLFSLFQSTLFEYLIEAVAEQPSIQDLIITPIVGSLLGEVLHRLTLKILSEGRPTFLEKVLVFVINPAYVINNGYRPPGPR